MLYMPGEYCCDNGVQHQETFPPNPQIIGKSNLHATVRYHTSESEFDRFNLKSGPLMISTKSMWHSKKNTKMLSTPEYEKSV